MNKCILSLLFVLFCMTINAQTHPSYVGIKGGIIYSKLTGNNSQQFPLTSNYSFRQDKNLEIFIETKISKSFTFHSAGLEFSSQGGMQEGFQAFLNTTKYVSYFQPGQAPKYLYADFKRETKLNYLSLVTLLKFGSNADKKSFIKFYIGVGCFSAFLLTAKEISDGTSIIYLDKQGNQPLTNSSEVFKERVNIKNELHKFNFGISGNFGISFSFGKSKFFIEGYGNYGLININKEREKGKNFIESTVVRIGFEYNIGQVFSFIFQNK